MLVYHYHSELRGIQNTDTFHTSILSSSVSEKTLIIIIFVVGTDVIINLIPITGTEYGNVI